MAISDKDTNYTESAFDIINNLETIFNGAFVKTADHPTVDENFFTVHVKTEAGSTSICFRKEVLGLPIIKSAGRGRPKHSKLSNGHEAGVKKKPRIFSNWLECKLCDYKCRKKTPLQNHMLEVHNEIVYLCEHCDEMSKDKTEMQEHEKTVHGGIKYPCPELDCPFTTADVKELEDHVEIHQESIIPCELCEYKAQSMRKLNVHMDECHEGINYYCSFCEFTTNKKEDLKIHEDMMHKHNQICCSRCDFTTSNGRLLKSHEETFHKTIEYKCSQCEFTCNWESSLKQHVEKCHGAKDFECEHCDFTCKWKTGFNKHMRDKHSDVSKQNTQCTFCGVQFACRRDLKKHIKDHHEKPVEFNCSYCGKSFPKKPNLKIHERIHTGEKPYKCETCGHAFTAASNLYHHKKKHMKDPCTPKAIKQESKNATATVQGIYEQGYLPQHDYRNEDNISLDHMPPQPLPHLDSPGDLDPPILMDGTKTETQSYQDPSSGGYLSNFPQYYGGGGSSNGGGSNGGGGGYHSPVQNNKMQNSMYDQSNSQYMDPGPAHPSPNQYRRQNSGGESSNSNYRRFEEQYRMLAQEEEYRKRSIEEQYRKFATDEQYRKFATEEHYRKLASEEQYRRLASLAASKNDRGGLWMPALH